MSPDPLRLTAANAAPVRGDGAFVLYWMTAQRRSAWNHALDRAVDRARELRRPLVVLEALRCDHPWASLRFHRFLVEGMRANAAAFAGGPALYHPYVEPAPGAGRGLVEALAAQACLVVTDDSPAFFLPAQLAAIAPRLPVLVEAVDGNGLLPLRAARTAFPTAVAFRRHLQGVARDHLERWPRSRPFAGPALPRLAALPAAITARWPAADPDALLAGGLARLPIDQSVGAAPLTGGGVAGGERLRGFLAHQLDRYDERSHPDAETASGLSPWLHFGHVGTQQAVHAVLARAGWTPERLGRGRQGRREGWWGLDACSEAFLDELVVWRELGYGFCHHRPDHERFDGLPGWALKTLAEHAGDARPHRYDRDAFAAGRTHDPLWNAAQRQLREEGRMPNYLRMLWGKKVLEWSATPQEAWATLIDLNNRYALDGRDPNSSSGIAWCFGRFDRPWAPVRPILGCLRYMTSGSTLKKLKLKRWLAQWGGA